MVRFPDCMITSALSFPASHVLSYTLFALVGYIFYYMINGFRLYHHIIFTCYSVALYRFQLWSNLSIRHFCAVIRTQSFYLLKVPVLMSSRMRFHQFVAGKIHAIIFLLVSVTIIVMFVFKLSVLLLASVISLSLHFLMLLSSPHFDSSTLSLYAGESTSFSLSWHIYSLSFLEGASLLIFLSFVPCIEILSSSISRMILENSKGDCLDDPLMKFLLKSLVSIRFLIRLRNTFLIYYLHLFDDIRFQHAYVNK